MTEIKTILSIALLSFGTAGIVTFILNTKYDKSYKTLGFIHILLLYAGFCVMLAA